MSLAELIGCLLLVMLRKPRSVQPDSTKPLSSERLRSSLPKPPMMAFQHWARVFHRKGASVIDISGTQFMSPTPIAPISSDPMRTACAVSRSLPIWPLAKIWTCLFPPLLSPIVFLNCSAQIFQPCAGGAGCAKRMRLTAACARTGPDSNAGQDAVMAAAPAAHSTSLRVTPAVSPEEKTNGSDDFMACLLTRCPL